MAVLEEGNDALSRVDAEQGGGEENRESDAAIAIEDGHDEPVAEVRHQPLLVPPGRRRIARRVGAEDGEHDAHGDGVGQHAQDRVREEIHDVGEEGRDHGRRPVVAVGRLAFIPCAKLSTKFPPRHCETRRLVICWPMALSVVMIAPEVVRSKYLLPSVAQFCSTDELPWVPFKSTNTA